MRPARLLVFIALLLAAVGVGCGGSGDETGAPQGSERQPTTSPASGRAAAPPLAGTALGGERISLEHFRGRPVLVNVWSSW